MGLSPAERLLQDLGVTEPDEIDLEAIAFHTNARVRFRPLDGCEARIIGNGDQAIITINARSTPRRQRFSLAHELGHWHHHRGKHLVCKVDDFRPNHALSPERVADGFAADLLMPNYLFRPLSRQHRLTTFQTVNRLADVFKTSPAATAIRLIESDHSPAILVCHGREGRRWFCRAPSVPSRWFPQDNLDSDSFAFDILFASNGDDTAPHKIGADAWFDRRDAERFEVLEQSIRTWPDEVLTLIQFNDAEMLND